MIVWCVLKSGGRYTPEWVERLHKGVARQWPDGRALTFSCLTDLPGHHFSTDIKVVPLLHDWPGWWSKLELWRADLPAATGFYLDLDSIVSGPLEPLVASQGACAFRAMSDALHPANLQSAMMRWSRTWNMEQGRKLYMRFKSNPAYHMQMNPNGDQQFIQKHVPFFALTPHSVVCSYREHWSRGLHRGASVIQFHGLPKMNDLDPSDPLVRLWHVD